MPTDLQGQTAKIHALRVRKPTESAIASVEAALRSKWEGIQSAAVRVLGSWGDSESIERLRVFLDECEQREFGWSIRGVIVRELAGCVGDADVSWVLDRYISLPGVLKKHEFLPVVLSLPPDAARDRLILEGASQSRDNRQAAMKALGNMDYPDKALLLKPFLKDRDPEIRSGARYLCST